MAMQEKQIDRGITYFEKALELDPSMNDAMYQLSLAYALNRDIGRARAMAMRLSQVQPRYPGLADWMKVIGIGPR
jgi:Tfp pilus assembly protein PilF